MQRRLETVRARTLQETKERIAMRIARVCGHLDPAELDALVERMAIIDIKYTMRRTESAFGRASPATDRRPG